jgi:hypothetical protein
MKRILILAALLATPAWAHETTGQHGGSVVDAGSYHIELVANDTAVNLYVTDGASKEVDASAFKGTAILLIDGKPQRIALSPAGGNRLTGTSSAAISKAPKGAVQLQIPNGTTVQGKF